MQPWSTAVATRDCVVLVVVLQNHRLLRGEIFRQILILEKFIGIQHHVHKILKFKRQIDTYLTFILDNNPQWKLKTKSHQKERCLIFILNVNN